MSFDHTVKELRAQLAQVTQDLEKSVLGNKAAAQRVRTGTVRLEKIAKQYRKESILDEKKSASHSSKKSDFSQNGTSAKGKSSAKAKPASKSASASKPVAKKAPAAASKAKAAPAKAAAKPVAAAKPATAAAKKPTAKLPARKPARAW
jgi:cobalamin biosynthesis Mg chelatase CobN